MGLFRAARAAERLGWGLLAGTLAGCDARLEAVRASPGEAPLVAERGSFEKRVLLTGVLEAVHAAHVTCPRTRTWQVQIRWMAEDGELVRKGQTILELDNASVVSDLEEKRLKACQARLELLRMKAQAAAERSEKRLALEERRTERDKARIDADVPRELLSLREYQDRKLALSRAAAAYEKAKQDLEAHDRATPEKLAVQKAHLDEAAYAIREAETAIELLSVRAPRDGVLLVSRHPWEDRKLAVGDTVWPGFTLISIPDTSAMRVRAVLSDVDDGAIAAGEPAQIVLDAYPEESFEGFIEEVTPVARELGARSTRRGFQVVVALAKTDPSRMRPGMAARVEVVALSREAVLLVPRAALDLEDAEHPKALLAEGKAVAVELGACNALTCIVENGLEVGARLRPHTGPP